MKRRAFLLSGLATASLLPLAACAAPGGPVQPLAQSGPDLRTVWSRRPAGPLPATGDEGVPLLVTNLGVPAVPSIAGGAAVGNLTGKGAVYLSQELGRPVRTLGARFAFGPGDPLTGSLCLATWTRRPISDTQCHFVIGPHRWIYSVASGTTLTALRDGPVSLPQDGTRFTVSIDLDGGPTAAITLPDGSVETVTDPSIADVRGSVPGWEFFSLGPGAATVLLDESWAS
ncbi:hypothetical protein [Actinomycetospora chiangmaiensis]|uniref:hypothetical protein n=1 Tax=Actinomycetospora chiangmaiensis TaxID=402650 RepID=UPI0003741398|nr:hypothetical protein [Actinomycetospora chiangmaiensis]